MLPQGSTFSANNPFARTGLSLRWLLLLGLLALSSGVQAGKDSAVSKDVELGRRIYMEGILPSGKPLQGKRQNTASVEGATAACQNCHRASGMGSLEGNIMVPPIASHFLFAKPDDQSLAIVDIREASNVLRRHAAYTEASFTKVLHQGVKVSGKKMNPLMPRYDLSKSEIKALMAYLKQLSAEVSPGVSADSVEFAVIVTPDVAAKERDSLVSMVQMIFNQRNNNQRGRSGQMKMPLDLLPRTSRSWKLSTWELKGEPASWDAQLREFYRQKPVFAVVAGMSNSNWAPVNNFCEREKLPCMLPSADVVPDKPGFYNLYYSHGVALEAQVLAKYLKDKNEVNSPRVVQIYRDTDAGNAATAALIQALKGSTIQVETRKLTGLDAAHWQEAVKGLTDKDQVMLWLDSEALAAASKALPKLAANTVFASGMLANDDFSSIPKSWSNLRVVYPYELGDKRAKNMEAYRLWAITFDVARVNEVMQSEVYFNLVFLTDLMSQMLDNLYRNYMLERAEDMLSFGTNFSPYPRLSMSRGQRFASKGAYIAKLAEDGELVTDSDWIVP
jgi:cytochrome c553